MIVGVAGWRGVGASTVALLLAAALGDASDPAVLVEADPAGGVLAARMGLDAGALERLAVAAARRASDGERLCDLAPVVGAVRVVTAPGDPFRAWSCLAGRSTWIDRLDELGDDVVVDLGRLRGGHPHGTLLDRLDALLVVSGADAISIAATAEWAAHGGRMSAHDRPLSVDLARMVIVDAPDRQRCSRTDVMAELGDRFAGWMPWDAAAVEHIERGSSLDDRRVRRRPIAQAARRLADGVVMWAGGAPRREFGVEVDA